MEVEENIVDEFKVIGDSGSTARLRTQEEIHQKASAALSDEVSIIVNSTHPPISTSCSLLYILTPIMATLHE